MKKTFALITTGIAALGVLVSLSGVSATPAAHDSSIERGRYLVKIMGCNDCHTAGYAQTGGETPEAQWLTGDAVGWQGPWGTTYATNLRLQLANYSEEQWLAYARSFKARPPMPWFTLNHTDEADLRAVYRYVRSLGPAGVPAPAYLAPGQIPAGPAIRFPAPPPAAAASTEIPS